MHVPESQRSMETLVLEMIVRSASLSFQRRKMQLPDWLETRTVGNALSTTVGEKCVAENPAERQYVKSTSATLKYEHWSWPNPWPCSVVGGCVCSSPTQQNLAHHPENGACGTWTMQDPGTSDSCEGLHFNNRSSL